MNGDVIRVLLVDDQELFRRGVTMVLGADGGFEIEDVDDGDSALHRIAEEPFDVVLLDVRMPGRSGVEVCAAIKETSPTTGIIMGGVVVAPYASELIHAVSIAVGMRMDVDRFSAAFTVYPSMSGSLAEAARRLHHHQPDVLTS